MTVRDSYKKILKNLCCFYSKKVGKVAKTGLFWVGKVVKILLTFQKLESTIVAHTTVGGAINVKENLFLYETV